MFGVNEPSVRRTCAQPGKPSGVNVTDLVYGKGGDRKETVGFGLGRGAFVRNESEGIKLKGRQRTIEGN